MKKQDKIGKPRGDWTLESTIDTSKSHTPGCVNQTWTNSVTGATASLFANVGGNGPQVKTLNNAAKPK